jgi:putative phosphoesterase
MPPTLPAPPFRIGVIADTHSLFDDRVTELFAGVDHILHAGDVGRFAVLDELRAIAPVTVVMGNVDSPEMGWRLTEFVELAGHGYLLHHIFNPHRPAALLAARIADQKPSAVIFGHTHQPFSQVIRGVLYLNPGPAGQARFHHPRSVAVLHADATGLRAEFHTL